MKEELGNKYHGGGCHSTRADFVGSDMLIWTDIFLRCMIGAFFRLPYKLACHH